VNRGFAFALWGSELGYPDWVEACLVTDNPDVGKVLMSQPPILLEEANQYTVADLVDGLVADRAKTLALIGRLSLADFDRVGTHPAFSTLTVLQYLRSLYRHDRQHRDQIEGREPEYQARTLEPAPDQRERRRRFGLERLRRPHTVDEVLAASREQPST
jgi:DinB superfamily